MDNQDDFIDNQYQVIAKRKQNGRSILLIYTLKIHAKEKRKKGVFSQIM